MNKYLKKLKNEYFVASNCQTFYVPTLNEEIIKNKTSIITTKAMTNGGLTGTSAMVEIANLCLEADNKNEVMAIERKERSKNTLSEDYKTICEQDHSDSKQLLGHDLADNVKKAKATHYMNQSIANKKLRLTSSSPKNPTSLYSRKSKASASAIHFSTSKAARRTSSALRQPPGGIRNSSLG